MERRPASERREELVALYREARSCTRCPLFQSRTQVVFGNGNPQPDEIDACKPYLYKQVELIEPKVVCTLGNFATKLLTRSSRGIRSVRGRVQIHELGGRRVRLYPLYHPAAALRTPAVKAELKEDFARLPELLAEPAPEPAGVATPQ